MFTMQRTIILFLALFGSALLLNVPITVKETARTGTDGFPVTFVLPLPYGSYIDTQKLNIVDEAGTAVPAQFNVLNKYWTSTPQYLRHVLVHFQPSVSAWNGTTTTGIKKYFVRDDASAAAPPIPVTVQDASDATTVVTGPLKFILRKTAFTVINELWFDANSNGNFEDNEKIISQNTNNGGVFVERDGTTLQLDSDRSDLTWEVEESGPLRAVIRVDYPTLYNGTAVGQLKRGAAVRIYAYAGKPFVYIDYQLQNSANVPLSWFLYFKEMNVDFTLTNFNGNRVRVGMADKSVYEKLGANPNVRLFQHELLQGDLYDGASVVKSVTNQSNYVWLSLQDTSSNVAVTSTIRHFWERWPNALQASGNKMSVQLFPKGSATWTTNQKSWGLNPAGLYYLPDMSHFYKESFLYFHKADVSSDSVTNLIKLFHNPPVAVVPTSWYAQAKATLDFGGAVPINTPSVPTDVRMYKDKASFDTHNMVTFGNSDGLYRASSCTTGGWPYSAATMIASEDPADYFAARNVLLAEINTRPAWVAKYDFFRDFKNGIKLTENPYCGGTWRQFLGNGVPTLVASPITGTGETMGARDDEHGWFHHAEEAYYLTGNLWYKDWMKFITQFRQVRLHQLDPYPDMSHRGLGHSLQHAMSSFRVTGDVRVLDQMSVYLRKYVFPTMSPYYGDATTAGYQTGYLARWNSNFWQELSYGASRNATYAQYMAEAFANLYGMIDWNYQYGDFPYYRNRTQYPNSISTGPGLTLVDPELFVYLITGHDWFVNHTFKYVRSGLNGGQRPDGNFKTWIGQYENRIYYRLYNNYTRADTQPPVKVTDLVAYRKSGDSRTIFRWTPVPDAVRYHGVYCSRPISEAANFDQSVCNWWAGNAIGIPFGAGPFYQDSQYQYFFVDTNATLPAYIALFSFDDANNMSPMSNVAQASDTTSLTLPDASYVSIPIVYTDPGNGGNNGNSPSGGGSSSPVNNNNSVTSDAASLSSASFIGIAALLTIIALF